MCIYIIYRLTYAVGTKCLSGSHVRGISRLNVSGDGAMDSSIIISEAPYGNTFIAYFDGMC